jgi:hypothetical protein
MLFKILYLSILLSNLILAQGDKELKDREYFPINVGNKWEYIMEANEEVILTEIIEVNAKSSSGVYQLSDKRTVFNLREMESLDYYEYKNSMLLHVGSYGGLFNEGKHDVFISCPIILKFPLKIGKSWNYKTDGNKEIFLTVLKKHSFINTVYGNYKDVYEIEHKTNDGGEIFYYKSIFYACGIGMVKEEAVDKENNTRFLLRVLKSYTIK